MGEADKNPSKCTATSPSVLLQGRSRAALLQRTEIQLSRVQSPRSGEGHAQGSKFATAKRTAGGARRGRGSGAVREFPTTPHLLIPPLLLSMLTHSGAGSKRFLSVGLNERKDETID